MRWHEIKPNTNDYRRCSTYLSTHTNDIIMTVTGSKPREQSKRTESRGKGRGVKMAEGDQMTMRSLPAGPQGLGGQPGQQIPHLHDPLLSRRTAGSTKKPENNFTGLVSFQNMTNTENLNENNRRELLSVFSVKSVV